MLNILPSLIKKSQEIGNSWDGLDNQDDKYPEPLIAVTKKIKLLATVDDMKTLEPKLWYKPLNRKYPKRLDETDIDVPQTYQWPRSSSLDRETVGFIIAAQD